MFRCAPSRTVCRLSSQASKQPSPEVRSACGGHKPRGTIPIREAEVSRAERDHPFKCYSTILALSSFEKFRMPRS